METHLEEQFANRRDRRVKSRAVTFPFRGGAEVPPDPTAPGWPLYSCPLVNGIQDALWSTQRRLPIVSTSAFYKWTVSSNSVLLLCPAVNGEAYLQSWIMKSVLSCILSNFPFFIFGSGPHLCSVPSLHQVIEGSRVWAQTPGVGMEIEMLWAISGIWEPHQGHTRTMLNPMKRSQSFWLRFCQLNTASDFVFMTSTSPPCILLSLCGIL